MSDEDNINFGDLDCCITEALIDRASMYIEGAFDDNLPWYLDLDGFSEDILEKEEVKGRVNHLKNRFLTYLEEFRNADW